MGQKEKMVDTGTESRWQWGNKLAAVHVIREQKYLWIKKEKSGQLNKTPLELGRFSETSQSYNMVTWGIFFDNKNYSKYGRFVSCGLKIATTVPNVLQNISKYY